MNYEEHIKDLVKESVELFQQKKRAKQISNRVHRGRASSVADLFEEKFAEFLERITPVTYSFFVDQAFSYRINTKERAKTFYPDIAVVKENTDLVGIIELKIDIGYLSSEWASKSKAKFDAVCQSGEVTYIQISDDYIKSKIELRVADNIIRSVVLLSGTYNHGRLNDFRKQTGCIILCSERHHHPNDLIPKDTNITDYLEGIYSDRDGREEWRRLAEFIHDNFN